MNLDPVPANSPSAELTGCLTDSVLKRLAGSTVFQRGQTYASSGAVQVVSEELGSTPTIHATVNGTEAYSSEVWIDEDILGGSCDCAYAEDGSFCKHQVALALVWRDRLGGQITEIDDAAAKKVQASVKRARTVKDRRQALDEFLHAQTAQALADRLMQLADRDSAIARELQQWRKISAAPESITDLKPLVTEILAPGIEFISWRESFAYARRAEAVLPVLAQARSTDPVGAVRLALHAMRRSWGVLNQSDDSSGDIGGLIKGIGAEFVAALKGAGPQAATFGDSYLQLLMDDPFGCFDTAAAELAIGKAAVARYRKALAERWRAAKDKVLAEKAAHAALVEKARSQRRREPYYQRDTEREVRLFTLERMHLEQLERAGDIDGVLAVLREDLSSAADHHQVTAFLEKHGRLREAFASAEQALKAFPGDSRLQEDMLRCYERDGWVEEALELSRRRFDEHPGVDRYHQVLKAGTAAWREVEALRAELHEAMTALETRAAAQRGPLPMHYRNGPDAGQRDVSLRAEVLCSEGRWTEALAAVQPPTYCRDAVLAHLARKLSPAHKAERVALLKRVLGSELRDAKSPYRAALDLVAEVCELLNPMQRTAWLDELREAYKPKRNFVRDLPAG